MRLRIRWLTLTLAFVLTMVASLAGRTDLVHATTQYVVHKGDTLWGIARTHHTSVNDLMKVNHLTTTVIQIHQHIDIPPSSHSANGTSGETSLSTQEAKVHAANQTKTTSRKPVTVYHTVVQGDTLWAIARVNHTSVKHLEVINNLRSTVLRPGQRLRVYVGSQKVYHALVVKHYKKVGLPIHLIPVYQAAGKKYDIPWTVLAAIHRVETHFGTGQAVSYAGAEGPMQFMPSTFRAYAVKAPGHRHANINNVEDAIYTAAHMLSAKGFLRNPVAALYDYNHSFAYVDEVLSYARLYQV